AQPHVVRVELGVDDRTGRAVVVVDAQRPTVLRRAGRVLDPDVLPARVAEDVLVDLRLLDVLAVAPHHDRQLDPVLGAPLELGDAALGPGPADRAARHDRHGRLPWQLEAALGAAGRVVGAERPDRLGRAGRQQLEVVAGGHARPGLAAAVWVADKLVDRV